MSQHDKTPEGWIGGVDDGGPLTQGSQTHALYTKPLTARCSNCHYFQSGTSYKENYCSKWDAIVRRDYICDSWQEMDREVSKNMWEGVGTYTNFEEFYTTLLYTIISNEEGAKRRSSTIERYKEYYASIESGGVVTEGNYYKGQKISLTGKMFNDLVALDSGTVGIAHWAAGGLSKLYQAIDCQTYFGKSLSELKRNYAHKKSNAYSHLWWRVGFKKWFENEPKNKMIQQRVWRASRQGAVQWAIAMGWKTNRALAISCAISNTQGNGGFKMLSKGTHPDYDWPAFRYLDNSHEEAIKGYIHKFSLKRLEENNISGHRSRRLDQINKWFPKSSEHELPFLSKFKMIKEPKWPNDLGI